MRRSSIRLRLLAALAGAILGLGAAGALAAARSAERAMEGAAADSLRRAATLFAVLERSEVEKLGATLDALLVREDLRRLFLARDRAGLQAAAEPLFRVLRERDRITHWYFVEPGRECFLRVHRPELFGDHIARVTLARAAQTGHLAWGKELGQTAFALRVVRPWVVEGRTIGYLELAEEIGHFLVRMKQETGNDLGILVKKKFLDEKAWSRVLGGARGGWEARRDVVVMDTTNFAAGLIDFAGDLEEVPDGGTVLEEELRGGRALIRGVFPMRDAADRKVGALFVLNDFTTTHQALAAERVRVVVAVVALALLALGLAWLALELILFRRLRRAIQALEPPGGPLAVGGDELERLEALAGRVRSIDAP